MSRKLLITVFAMALLAIAGALPARADRSCSFVCDPDVWCGTRCVYGGQLVTCLNFGPCNPNHPTVRASTPREGAADLRDVLSPEPGAGTVAPACWTATRAPAKR
jgi:hypothetical protein